MVPLNRFQIMQHMKPKISEYFSNLNDDIFSINDLAKILNENRERWILPKVTTRNDFIKFLLDKKILEEVEIILPNRKMKKYVKHNVSIYELALSINKKSYLSHYTAMFFHSLTENIPKVIYTNTEQVKKNNSQANIGDVLSQESIDNAFKRPMRKTNQIAKINDYSIYMLNGKNVDRIGVIEYDYNGTVMPISDIERTLIDITVRPGYSGGVREVLNAYIAARDRFSVNRLIAMLKKMGYIYPYHQAIGFYLEKAGFGNNLLRLVEKLEIKYDFYLTYQMKETEYSSRWRLFYPKGL